MLPIEEVLPEIKAVLRHSPNAVIVAPPGAGKTTGVPLALLDEPWMAGARLILLSPRRLAARAAAQRMASLLGEPVGQTVGYRVRLDSKVSAATRIEVVTEGVFTRQILADPELAGVAAVLFDECHERSLDGDLGLALALDAQGGLREDLRLIAMSATLDGARFSGLMGNAPVIESQGRMFPIETPHVDRDQSQRIEQQAATVAMRALAAEAGSILLFLPGAAEIERTASLIEDRLDDPAVSVHRLYGAREAADQSAAIAPSPPGMRKIVLATAIAETSLTIDGVRVVIDSGLARRPRYEPDTGVTRLETVRVSRAAAEQRRGRAGRLEPGLCIRLWAEPQTRALLPFDPPEILEADLAGLALDLALWGVADPAQLRWLDPPPAGAFTQARRLLADLGALDDEGRMTPHGRQLAQLPLPPRLAHMILAAVPLGHGLLAARIAGLIGERGLGGTNTDLRSRLERFDRESTPRARALKDQAARWARLAGGRESRIDIGAAGLCLALAYPERVAQARSGQRGQFLLANGRGARLDGADALAGEAWLAAGEVAGAAEQARILLAAPISPLLIEELFASRIVTEETASVDRRLGTVRAVRRRRLGALVLSEQPLPTPSPDRLADAFTTALQAEGLALIRAWPQTEAWRGRVAFLRTHLGDDWPALDEAGALASIERWFPLALGDSVRLGDISAGDLERALAMLLPAGQGRQLDQIAPERFTTPAGTSHAIDYAAEGGPAVDVRIQELFGLGKHPTIAEGRVPLLLRLLSPAHRPVQTTRDLPGFWRGSYAAVRTEMRGRYPKHPWPDNPLEAQATTRAKPRGT